MSGPELGIVGFGVLFVLLMAGLPVGLALGLVGVAGFAGIVTTEAALHLLAKDFVDVLGAYDLTVIPLFILMGQLSFRSGISTRLFHTAYHFMGHWPGGMAIATIGACTGFAAICGSTNATAATMASVTLPEMKKYHYRDDMAAGVVAVGGSLGILIPPSVVFIVYGVMTQQSVGRLFIAGILPGLILAVLFAATIVVWAKVQPQVAPRARRQPLKAMLASLSGVAETLVLFALVMGGLFKGFFTPTEAGGVGAVGTLVIAVCRRTLSWQDLGLALQETCRISCMVLTIVAGATVFGHFLAVTHIPFEIAGWVIGLQLPAVVVMGMIIVVYLIGGCIIDALALVMLTVPIFFPLITALGYDPIWFGVIVVMLTQIGVVTPPVGLNAYVVCGVSAIPLQVVFKGVMPLLAALILGTLLLIPFPQIALFLPRLMAGGQ